MPVPRTRGAFEQTSQAPREQIQELPSHGAESRHSSDSIGKNTPWQGNTRYCNSSCTPIDVGAERRCRRRGPVPSSRTCKDGMSSKERGEESAVAAPACRLCYQLPSLRGTHCQ